MTLIVALGGVRSGKSAWAETQAQTRAGDEPVTVLTTADPSDPSMTDRIARHQARRPASWPLVELHGADLLATALPATGVSLLDGLGGWIADLLSRAGAFSADLVESQRAAKVAAATAHGAIGELIEAVHGPGRTLVIASEEAGLGLVPLGAGTAAWVDLLGELNQRLVAAADLAVVVVAGRPLPLTDNVVLPGDSAGDPSLEAPPVLTPLTLLAPSHAGTPVPSDDDEDHDGPGEHLTPALLPSEQPPASPPPPHVTTPPLARSGPAGDDFAALRTHGDRMVRPGDADHAVNIVAEGPPAWLLDALRGTLEHDLAHYPDATGAEAALAGLYGRRPSEVVATNGAAQAFWLLPAALRPTLAACIYPLFTEAEAALRAHGVPVVRVLRDPLNDFALDPSAIPDEADLVIVSNPAAASGTLTARETVLSLRRPGRVLVVDEAFMDLVPGETESLAGESWGDLIVVRSFTKSLSIPGLRAGAALAGGPLAAALRGVQPPWSVNALAGAALLALADHPAELPARARRVTAERRQLDALLADLPGVRRWPSATNHLLLGIAGGRSVVEALRAQRIAVRPCGSFPGLTDDHLRITARDPAANRALAAALAGLLSSSAL